MPRTFVSRFFTAVLPLTSRPTPPIVSRTGRERKASGSPNGFFRHGIGSGGSDDALPLRDPVCLALRLSGRAARCASASGQASRSQQPAPRQRRVDPRRHGALPDSMRRLSRHWMPPGIAGPTWLRPSMSGELADERLFRHDPQGRARHRDARGVAIDVPDDDILLTDRVSAKLGSVAPAERTIGNLENGERTCSRQQCAICHRVAGRGGRLGPDLTRIGVAAFAASLVREIRTPSEWIAAHVRDGHDRHEAGSTHPRRQEERRRLLHSDHGHRRADPGVSQVEPAGSDLREDLVDARLSLRSPERQRYDRPGRLPRLVARRGRAYQRDSRRTVFADHEPGSAGWAEGSDAMADLLAATYTAHATARSRRSRPKTSIS